MKNNGGCFLLESKHLCYQLPLIAEGVWLQCLSVWNRLKEDCRWHTLILSYNAAERCFTLPEWFPYSGCLYLKRQQDHLSIQMLPHKGRWGREPIRSLPACVRKSTGAPYICPDIISQSAALQPNTAKQRQCESERWRHTCGGQTHQKTDLTGRVSVATVFREPQKSFIYFLYRLHVYRLPNPYRCGLFDIIF